MLEFTWGLITKTIGLKLFLQYLHDLGEEANGNGRERRMYGSLVPSGTLPLEFWREGGAAPVSLPRDTPTNMGSPPP